MIISFILINILYEVDLGIYFLFKARWQDYFIRNFLKIKSCLSFAAEKGHKEVVKFLIKNRAKLWLYGSSPSPEKLARENGHMEIVSILEQAAEERKKK